MGRSWGLLVSKAYEYSDEARALDEQLLSLMRQRRELSKEKPLYPGGELVEEWVDRFGISEYKIHELLRMINGPVRRMNRSDYKGELRTVVPLMKTMTAGDFIFQMTHIMQYDNWSELTLNIKYNGTVGGRANLDPNLTLAVYSELETYEVRRGGGSGGSEEITMQFIITPPVPDQVDEISFALVPSEPIFEPEIKIKVLEEPVRFK
ncbi:hypothetical protein [Paenibacillus caui]|uniref:hypothetical protein n=1 Tax=Paenibacillus caui TaxID=2873927 RepID=UPI001CA801EC|nr:hypothetical protein [Paenibacillus caui]